MAVSDPVADMLTKIRNASRQKFDRVDVSTSKIKLEVVKILKNEGYVKNFKKVTQEGLNHIRVFLKYDDEMQPVIHDIQKNQSLADVNHPVGANGGKVLRLPRLLIGVGEAAEQHKRSQYYRKNRLHCHPTGMVAFLMT